MVETLEEAKREGKKDIPRIGKIKNVDHAPEWKKKFGYPTNEIPIADYYVEYNYNAPGFGSKWLIEASSSNLYRQIIQIEASAEFFKQKNILVDTYLVVLNELSRRDKQKYSLKKATLKPLKQVYERSGYDNKRPYIIQRKQLFLIFRKEFGILTK